MQYTKPALTIDKQADLLIQRGLVAQRALLIHRLQMVNYYRFSGYLYPFRLPNDNFQPGTTLETVWRRYVFDRRLRLLVLDPIERLEVAVRTHLAHEHAHNHGPFGYTSSTTLPRLGGEDFGQLLCNFGREYGRSKEMFAKHFKTKYKEHQYLPIWMAVETMTFGQTLTFFRGSSDDIRKAVASPYGQSEEVFTSWLLSLNTIRNICAHHGRLWNRTLGITPMIPKKQADWHTPTFAHDKVFAVLCILQHSLKVTAPQSLWAQRLQTLLHEFPDVPAIEMGFPDEWQSSPIWR
jgi:abortive infection bacteriophage resistance protein